MTAVAAPTYASERWFQLLRQAADTHGVRGTAALLGYANHTGTSQILNGCYAGGTDAFATRVLERFDTVDCPHLAQSLTSSACRQYASRPCPINSSREVRHWRACQGCAHRPQEEQA